MTKRTPVVMTIAGHDPCGGAGIQADIEVMSQLKCYSVSVLTTLTVQNTQKIQEVRGIDSAFVKSQMAFLFADMSISAIKLGLMGSSKNQQVIFEQLRKKRAIPLIVDPIVQSDSGFVLSAGNQQNNWQKIAAQMTIITPNIMEAEQLSDDHCFPLIQYILVTGTHAKGKVVKHTLYHYGKKVASYQYPRLAGVFHGSGCTLSAAIAAYIAWGEDVPYAVTASLEYTYETLKPGYSPGQGQYIPRRR